MPLHVCSAESAESAEAVCRSHQTSAAPVADPEARARAAAAVSARLAGTLFSLA